MKFNSIAVAGKCVRIFLLTRSMMESRWKRGILIITYGFLCLFIVSCESLIDVGAPKSEIERPDAFADDLTAESTIRGIYSAMMTGYSFANGDFYSVTFACDLSADNLINYIDPAYDEFYTNSLTPSNTVVRSLWESAYSYIYFANSALEGLKSSSGVTPAIRTQLEGEARFIRAFCYFYLVNMFGDVPLILSTDYRVNKVAFRTPQASVYQQIITDLEIAQISLAADYTFSKGERVRPNIAAATALLARVYLYTGDWANAEAQATAVIDNSLYGLENDLENVFLANSNEAIWQLTPVIPGYNTYEGQAFTLLYVGLDPQLYDAFETEDKRKYSWIDSIAMEEYIYYYPYKYKIADINTDTDQPATEYSMVLRLAEQYLIRAEARAQQNNISGSRIDLNTIRDRAGLENTDANDKAALLQAIEKERRTELFAEWGHRWFDLKRTSRVDAVLAPLKGPYWQSSDALYPVPQSEIEANKNLDQNPDY